ncbi:MAG: tyrosine-type recombinase/integrase [Syntrophomonadaceae bacterium]
MATLFVRGKYYYIRFYDRLLGYSKYISTGCPTTREGKMVAMRKLREIQTQLILNRFDPLSGGFFQKRQAESLKVSEGFKRFLEKREEKNEKIAPKTLEAYNLGLMKLYEAIGDTYVHTVTPAVNKSLKDTFDKAESSLNTRSVYTRALHSLFEFFVSEGITKQNPINALPVIKKRPKAIQLKEIRRMLGYLKEREEYYHTDNRKQSFRQAYDLIKFLALSGFRINEADSLDWTDIDMENRLILVVHNKKENREDLYFPIHKELYEHLLSMNPKPEGKVFDAFQDKRSIRSIWETMNEKLGMDYNIHQLRKTTATVLSNGAVSHLTVQNFIRHKSFQTTLDSYAEAKAKAMRDEIESKVKFDL